MDEKTGKQMLAYYGGYIVFMFSNIMELIDTVVKPYRDVGGLGNITQEEVEEFMREQATTVHHVSNLVATFLISLSAGDEDEVICASEAFKVHIGFERLEKIRESLFNITDDMILAMDDMDKFNTTVDQKDVMFLTDMHQHSVTLMKKYSGDVDYFKATTGDPDDESDVVYDYLMDASMNAGNETIH